MDKHEMVNLIKTLLRDEVLTNNEQELIDYSIETDDTFNKNGTSKDITIRISMEHNTSK